MKDELPDDLQFKEIFIETQNTIKYRDFIIHCLEMEKNILINGSSGTGKTKLISKILKD